MADMDVDTNATTTNDDNAIGNTSVSKGKSKDNKKRFEVKKVSLIHLDSDCVWSSAPFHEMEHWKVI